MTKKIEVLGNEVEILKSRLDISELKCRHLQIDISEFRGLDNFAPYFKDLQEVPKPKDFGPVDKLFKMMIEKRAYHPVESILQFRRIVELMCRMPTSLKVQSVAMHMCSTQMMHILDVDMICIYISDFNVPTKIRKFTIRSQRAEEFDLDASKSILNEVFETGLSVKYSNMKENALDPERDGCPGVIVKNMMSIPLKDNRYAYDSYFYIISFNYAVLAFG
jgi:hypothetical protein